MNSEALSVDFRSQAAPHWITYMPLVRPGA
jgi:hypothetical protein